jgi:drug/metabolite transporter (DMT)-like permease
VWRGAVLGSLLFAAYAVQTFGLVGTTPSKNAFLTATYCVLVPFLHWAVSRQRPDRFHLLAAFLCITGVGLVSLNGSLTITWGDLLSLGSALFYALHIVAVNKLSDRRDIYLLTSLQFAFTALLAVIGGLLLQPFPAQALSQPGVFWPLAYLCVVSTTVALLCQNVGQVWSDPSSASVILSLESVFGVLFSVLFYGDPVTPRLLAGFGLIFIAVLCSETKFAFLRRNSPSPRL